MGKTLLILMAGFAISFGILAQSKNQRYLDAVDRMVKQVSEYSEKNAASSGVHKALNQLYLDPSWRGSYNNLAIAGGTANINVVDDSAGSAPKAHQVKIRSTSGSTLTEVVVFDTGFHEFAVWAKDTVIHVITRDSANVLDNNLLMQKAPYMPRIDYDGLYSAAMTQGHLENEDFLGHFHPSPNFPNSQFYYDSSAVSVVPNVIHVDGDLHVREDYIVYGIFIVEGDVLLDENARVRGVLYLPNAASKIYNNDNDDSRVTGGIVTWGKIDGKNDYIIVRHRPEYLRALVGNYAPNNPPIRVLTWK